MKKFLIASLLAVALVVFPKAALCSDLDPEQLAQAFLSHWYISNIRGLPMPADIDEVREFLGEKILSAFDEAHKKRMLAVSKVKSGSEPFPHREGDLLGGEWEVPAYFYLLRHGEKNPGPVKMLLVYKTSDGESEKTLSFVIRAKKIEEIILTSPSEVIELTKFLNSLDYK